ncbi:hypothetical protein BpHYR1_054645 [Brachionus plicatilis]|uniref:Uncharacterized protein n=1 Tax=Brachionus plicatilis TaxID=10195 RepID=A0A3M7R2S2_BRAPC|nr:hypothetical protein BpHYR1_054645 [Brachionus plicatilis]
MNNREQNKSHDSGYNSGYKNIIKAKDIKDIFLEIQLINIVHLLHLADFVVQIIIIIMTCSRQFVSTKCKFSNGLFDESKVLTHIETLKPIYKLENSVFAYCKLNFDANFINNVVFLLNLESVSVDLLEDQLDQENGILNENTNFNFPFDLLNEFCKNSKKGNKNIKYIPIVNEKKPFKILQCDKNVGNLLITNEDFLFIANQHSNDINTYVRLERKVMLSQLLSNFYPMKVCLWGI